MTISYNGYTCEEMYEQPCTPVLQAVRLGCACYECPTCGALTGGQWPPDEEAGDD
jgi:hypothetical protein